MGQVHDEYTDWALCGSCAQAWFRRASTGKRTDVQAQERGHQHLPCGLAESEGLWSLLVTGNHGKVPLSHDPSQSWCS